VGPDGLIAWLLALIAIFLSFFVEGKRLFAYAATLTATGAITVTVDTAFGWPLLISGVVILAVGLALMRRFVKRHPHPQAP
jgi:hypothetical protein